MPGRQQRISLADRVARQQPAWSPEEVERAIRAGEILVAGRTLVNPAARVTPDVAVRHDPPAELAGRRKLRWALARFGVRPGSRVVVDVGACTGGFTEAWLEAGARRVHAVDVGHGQLLGSLRQDCRVVNRERTNVAELTRTLIPEEVGALSVDVSYLSLSSAVAQLSGLDVAPGADLLGLVKPMFELRLSTIPHERGVLDEARDTAAAGVAAAGWRIEAVDECPVRGGRGAIEFFVHATHP